MSFSRVKPAGWGTYDVPTSAELNQLDINVSRALDGFAGGVFAPSAELEIQGDFAVTGAGSVLRIGDESTASELQIKAASTLSVESGGALSLLAGASCLVACDPDIAGKTSYLNGSELELRSGSVLDAQSGSVTTFAVGSAVTFNNTPVLQYGASLQAPISCGNAGRFRERVQQGTDSNMVVLIGDGTILQVKLGVLSTDRTYTMSTTDAVHGDVVHFFTADGVNAIVWSAGLTGPYKYSSGFPYAATFMYDSVLGGWVVMRISYLP